ncbi:MAG: hypothetical protein KKH91_00935 [Elusimicrobia bacterium]|nr:hypothetical protein [Elusimicrobiota bacterium]
MVRLIVAFLVILSAQTCLYCGDDFASSDIGKEAINLGLKFLDNPGDFLFNLHSDNVDFTPVIKDKNVTLRTNFYPTTFPTTWLNMNLKVKILSDGGFSPWVPQVDLLGEYGKMAVLDMVASSATKLSNSDYAIGVVVTKEVAENTRLYAGINYSKTELITNFDKPIEFGAFKLSQLSVNVGDTFIFTGIENQVREDPPKRVVAHLGYGLKTKKVVSRVAWYTKNLELGFNIYPEGLFVVHPFLAWHWYF